MLILAALLVASSARLPIQQDFDRCTLAAEDNGNRSLQGHLRLELLIRKSGEVYAAFASAEHGIEDRRLERCLTATALLWKLPAVPVDYQRPYVVSFAPGATAVDNSLYSAGQGSTVPGRTSVFLPDPNDPPPLAEVDTRVAQATLEVDDHATDAESGTAQLAVGRAKQAVEAFRRALAHDSTDLVALRGLAEALSSTDALAEARATAEKLVALEPDGVGGHEAMLTACLALRDDECAFAQWRAARAARDVAPRSRALAALQPAAQAVAERLRVAQGVDDPCGAPKTAQDEALCAARRCLDAGSAEYAKEISAQNHLQYELQPWTVKSFGGSRMVVTRTIASASGDRHDARWLVKLGDELVLTPASAEARQISLRHSRCAARSLGSR